MRGKMLRDETDFARGRPGRIDHQRGLDQRIGLQPRDDVARRIIGADETDEDAARAERGDIARDIAGAPDGELVALHRQHRRRRLRRNPSDLAIDEVVEHQVADAEDGLLADVLQARFEIQHAQRYRSSRSRNPVT
jgi:hypothetical protein